MIYEIVESKEAKGEWLVEAINYDGDGETYVTTFSGPNAEGDAKQYARSKIFARLRKALFSPNPHINSLHTGVRV
jgi:hypothetical protein